MANWNWLIGALCLCQHGLTSSKPEENLKKIGRGAYGRLQWVCFQKNETRVQARSGVYNDEMKHDKEENRRERKGLDPPSSRQARKRGAAITHWPCDSELDCLHH